MNVNFKSAFKNTSTSQIKKLPEFHKNGADNKNKKNKMKFPKEIVKNVQNQINETGSEVLLFESIIYPSYFQTAPRKTLMVDSF